MLGDVTFMDIPFLPDENPTVRILAQTILKNRIKAPDRF